MQWQRQWRPLAIAAVLRLKMSENVEGPWRELWTGVKLEVLEDKIDKLHITGAHELETEMGVR